MRLTSHGTGAARRRLRYHSDRQRALTGRGMVLGEFVFEVHAEDGRTYTLKLNRCGRGRGAARDGGEGGARAEAGGR